jgi:asparagine synthetase B (glutamine-hydrolysing)
VTNDLRLAVATQTPSVDPRGVYALLQYGAIPAPFTLFRGLRRLHPGHEASLHTPELTRLAAPHSAQATTVADAEALIVARLDDILLSPRPRAIFFSGGVDSGLLAARLAGAGVRDVTLLNYAFGSSDPEALHAARMAAHLGLPLERIEDTQDNAIEMLTHAVADYSYPFADCSSLPTNLLVRASTPWLPPGSEVVDGTGADGAFGLGFVVARALRTRGLLGIVPRWAGDIAGWLHAWGGFSADDGRFASLLRLMRRATMMPPLLATVTAQNSLHGECFYAARDARQEVEAAMLQTVATLASFSTVADRATVLDVVHVCGGIYAAKDYDPLRHRGVDAVYPFLHPDLLMPSLKIPWSVRCVGGQPKGLLKQVLARQVPAALVYRTKSGFRPPLAYLLTRPELREFIRERVLRRDNPLAAFLRWEALEYLFSRAFRGEPIHTRAYNLLWALTFAVSWLDGLRRWPNR